MGKRYHIEKERTSETALSGTQIKKPCTNGILAHIGVHAPTSMENYAVQAVAHVANITWSPISAHRFKTLQDARVSHNYTQKSTVKDENHSHGKSTSAKQMLIFTNVVRTYQNCSTPTWMPLHNATLFKHA